MRVGPAPRALDTLDFGALLRAGDGLVCGQLTSEPVALCERLYAAPDLPAGIVAFIGANLSGSMLQARNLRFTSYGAMFRSAELARRDALEVLPVHYSGLCAAVTDGGIPADVVLMQAARDARSGALYVGAAHGYLVAAARHARTVIVEVNLNAPVIPGGELPADMPIHILVESDASLAALAAGVPTAEESRIAGFVAGLVADGATVQIGIGALPRALLNALDGHRDLGLHSGILTDEVMRLMRSGVINNRRKRIDTGISVTGALIGSAALYGFARDAAVRLAPPTYTHAHEVVRRFDRFTALNSALEVDLAGQANTERMLGRPLGGIGGLVDFARGALASQDGRSVIALPSTARGGAVSRIVARLSGPATLGVADADAVVTEWGVARLRGESPAERARQMIAIADPRHRAALSDAARVAGLAG